MHRKNQRLETVKIILISIIGTILVSYVLIGLIFHSTVLQQYIKRMIEKEMSHVFKREVTIQKLSGNLLREAILTGVKYANKDSISEGTIFEMEKIICHYNLLSVIKNKGDFLAGASEIHLFDLKMTVIRDKDDRWNVLNFFPAPPPGSLPRPPTFKGILYLHNLYGTYIDYLGWSAKETRFLQRTFSNGFGQIDYDNLSKSKVRLSGEIEGTQAPFYVGGLLNARTVQYDLEVNVPDIDMVIWGEYVFPFEGFQFSSGLTTVSGKIVSKYPFPKKGIPFDYNLDIYLLDTSLKMPFFQPPLEHIYAETKLQEGTLGLTRFQGVIADIAIIGHGPLYFKENKLDLTIRSKTFQTGHIRDLFPGISKWRYEGNGQTKLTVKGRVKDPRINGHIDIPKGKFYAFYPKGLRINYDYKSKQLKLKITKGTLLGGNLGLTNHVDFKHSPARVSAEFSLENMSGEDIETQTHLPFTGHGDLKGHLLGHVTRYSISMSLNGPEMLLYDQQITSGHLKAVVENNEDIYVKRTEIYLNNSVSPLSINGKIQNLIDTTLAYQGTNIFLKSLSGDHLLGKAKVAGELKTQLGPAFWKTPLNEVMLTLKATLDNYSFFGRPFSVVTMNMTYDKGQINIKRFQAMSDEERLSLSGKLYKTEPRDLLINTTQFDLGRSQFVQNLVPEKYRPVSGKLDAKLRLKWVGKSAAESQLNRAEKYTCEGELHLTQGAVINQPIDLFSLKGEWKNNILSFDSLKLARHQSIIDLSGGISPTKKFSFNILEGTIIKLEDFEPYLSRFASLKGLFRLSGNVSGNGTKRQFDVDFAAVNPKYNHIMVDKIKGTIKKNNTKVHLENIRIEQDKNKINFDGMLGLAPFRSDKPVSLADVTYRLKVAGDNVDMSMISTLIKNIYQELWKKYANKNKDNGGAITAVVEKGGGATETIQFVNDPQFKKREAILYDRRTFSNSIGLFENVTFLQHELLQDEISTRKPLFKGRVSGVVDVQAIPGKLPRIQAEVGWNDLEAYFIKSKELFFQMRPKRQWHDIQLSGKQGNVGGNNFNEIKINGSIDGKGELTINTTMFRVDQRWSNNIIKGRIPLGKLLNITNKEKPLSVVVNLDGQDIEVVRVINKYIKQISNQGNVALRISGSLDQPIFNSKKMQLKNGEILFHDNTPFRSPFRIPETVLSVKNNVIRIPRTPIYWKGKDTQPGNVARPKDNTFVVSGNVQLGNATFLRPNYIDFIFNMEVANTNIAVNFPLSYSGDVALENIHIKGPFRVPFSTEWKEIIKQNRATEKETGPIIEGRVFLSNGVVSVPRIGVKKPKPGFLFNLDGKIGKDIIVGGSIFGEGLGVLANSFDLKLVETETFFPVKGSLNSPIFLTKLNVSEGTYQWLTRGFDVLNLSTQQAFFTEGRTELVDNTIYFQSVIDLDTGKRRNIPMLSLAAVTLVEPESLFDEVSTENPVIVSTPYKAVVLVIDGSLYEIDSLSFEEFNISDPRNEYRLDEIDINTWTIDYQQSHRMSSQENIGDAKTAGFQSVFRTLMPEYYQQLFEEFSEKSFDSDKTKRLINVLGEKQINSIFNRQLRPIERGFAKSLGIEDIKLNYNLGGAVLSGISTGIGYEGIGRETDNIGLDFVTKIIDRLFLRVRTNLDLAREETDETDAIQLSEVELSYFVAQNISLNYVNVRNDQNQYKPKYSLRADFEF